MPLDASLKDVLDVNSPEYVVFKRLRHEFADVFPESLPEGLPPVRSVDHIR